VSDEPGVIRSYQRIFRPERRIYSIEGHPLPVPGGVPLRWLAYASGSLLGSIVLAAHSPGFAFLVAVAAGIAGLGVGGRKAAALGAAVGLVGVEMTGWIVAALDWPLRLIVLPAAVATLATQATPDGRRPERFAVSWLLLRLAPRRRSLGRELPATGIPQRYDAELWVGADQRSPDLRRARVRGPARVSFSVPVEERRRRRKVTVRRLGWHRRRGKVARAVDLDAGEVLEVQP
jgi:hypothetical protein